MILLAFLQYGTVGGCVDSPECPTALLLAIGVIAFNTVRYLRNK